MRMDPALSERVGTGRRSEARLVFARGGGTTVLARQIVPYPFHITRPFRLEPDWPDLATLYLQSASGGLYRDDRLTLDVEARPGACAHVTTQSATVVHDTGALPARQDTILTLAPGAFLSLSPDPLVLFPGAALSCATRIVAPEGARAIVSEGFACHDPKGLSRPFAALDLSLEITDGTDVLVRERAHVSGADLFAAQSPAGPYRAYGTVLVLGSGADWPDLPALQARLDTLGCLAGGSALPNGAGLALRLLAPDGGRLASGLDAAFRVAFEALTQVTPGRRRK